MQLTSSIIDNIDTNVWNEIKKNLSKSEKVQFAVWFLFLSWLKDILPWFKDLEKIQILIWSRTNKSTAKILWEAFEQKFQTPYEIKQIKWDAKDEFADDVATEFKQTKEDKDFLNQLYEIVKTWKLEIKIYTKSTLHAKAYIFTAKEGSLSKGRCIIWSSNLSKSWFYDNTELNVIVDGDENYDKMENRFMKLWEESEDFSKDLLEIIDNSWLKAEPTPYEIYMRILYEMVWEYVEWNLSYQYDWVKELYQFQIDAVQQAVEIVNKYKWVFVSDVVWLWKTYTWSIIMKLLTDEHHSKWLVLCPAKLQKEWKIVLRHFWVNAEVQSIDALKNVVEDKSYDNVHYVLIDESHKFKDPNTQRYPLLQEFIHRTNKNLIMLSATPLNLNWWDIYHQIKLFHKWEITDLPIYPRHLRQFFKRYEEWRCDLSNLLWELMVRRTRLHIKRYYWEDMKRMHKDFPKRVWPFTEEYDLNKDYQWIYDEIESVLGQRVDWLSKKEREKLMTKMNDDEILQYRWKYKYAMYFKTNYIKEDCFKEDEKWRKTLDGTEFEDIQAVWENLRELAKITFYQRIESSPWAFLSTVSRMLKYNKIFLTNLENWYIFKTRHSNELEEYEWLFDDVDEESESMLELEDSMLDDMSYDITKFDQERYINDMREDIKNLEELKEKAEKLLKIPDVKMNNLLELLKENNDKKILIFSQYSDTTKYIVEKITKELPNRVTCEMSWTNQDSIVSILWRFSPNSQRYQIKEWESEIDILVATDIIAEWQNLQDANMVINYDLHWNPVRLIQRIWRIDRIWSENDKIYIHNFYPSNTWEWKLWLRSKVSERVNAIHKHIWEENKIISQEEELNRKMIELYKEMLENSVDKLDEIEELENEAKNIFVYSHLIKQLSDCKEKYPKIYKKIKKMPLRMRCAKKWNEKNMLVYCRYWEYDHCYIMNKDNEIENNKAKFLNLAYADIDTPREPLPKYHDGLTCEIEDQFYQDLLWYKNDSSFTWWEEKKTSVDMIAFKNRIRKYEEEYVDKYEQEEHDMIDKICAFIDSGMETWQKRRFKPYKKHKTPSSLSTTIITEMSDMIDELIDKEENSKSLDVDKKKSVVVSESIVK